jgi:hypothetical protein
VPEKKGAYPESVTQARADFGGLPGVNDLPRPRCTRVHRPEDLTWLVVDSMAQHSWAAFLCQRALSVCRRSLVPKAQILPVQQE